MVNQAFRIKFAYWSEKKEKEKENTRDRSVPDGSDKKTEDTMLNYIGEGIQQFQDDVN